ncbi:MAG: hypothetical protein EOP24_29895 [Hyphomicrobiales bacterium]|nr:MAG: hypothetical protein EOP24_29895 [Hyphomicrobiales bacterium]
MFNQDTPQELRKKAEIWFDRQCKFSSLAMGCRWHAHREWVVDFLRQEIEERLIAKGWRLKK